MIERYSRPEMANIWTEENKYRAWLEVEILADEAWAELGEIPKEDVALIREKADFDIDRILEIEQQTRHDVVAFTRAVSETLGEERKWVHYGLTSTDVVDTAYGYLYKQANDIIRKDLENFLNIIADKAKEHKFTIMMGRTHGVHAEPTTFGLKLATWYSEMKRNIERFPEDFMYQLAKDEWQNMSSQFVMTSRNKRPKTAIPLAFTEHGVKCAQKQYSYPSKCFNRSCLRRHPSTDSQSAGRQGRGVGKTDEGVEGLHGRSIC